MADDEIIESPQTRAKLVYRTDVLDKVKALATLPGHGTATTQQVADYYEISRETVASMAKYHRDEFESNGYRVVEGPELRKLKREVEVQPLLRQAKSAALWDRRAVLNLGMLLRDSEVAQAVRAYLLDAEQEVHTAVTGYGPVQPSSEVAALGSVIAEAITGWVTERIDATDTRVTSVESRITALEINPRTAVPPAAVPSAGSLAEVLDVPTVRHGKTLCTGIGRDGKPWAAYGTGRRFPGDWLDRSEVIEAYKLLADSQS